MLNAVPDGMGIMVIVSQRKSEDNAWEETCRAYRGGGHWNLIHTGDRWFHTTHEVIRYVEGIYG